MSVTYAVLRGAGSLSASNSSTSNSVDSWVVTPPSLTADNNGQMLVMFGSSILAGGYDAPPYDGTVTPTVPIASTLFSGVAIDELRIAGSYRAVSSGQSNSGSFDFAPGETSPVTQGISVNGLGAITLRFAPAADPGVTGYVSADGPLGAALIRGIYSAAGSLLVAGPLGAARVRGFHDFSAQVADVSPAYVMALTTSTGDVRASISSWQATLQTNGQGYVQCVIPACEPYLDAINDTTAFTIYRTASLPGVDISYQMASAAPDFVQLAQGPNRYTALMSGYSEAFAADAGLPSSLDRPLLAVRSVFAEPSGLRVRCAVDWLLRPGMRAVHGAVTFDVGTINYYCADGDQYMDVKEDEAV